MSISSIPLSQNPFSIWVRKADRAGVYCAPDDEIVPLILEHFKIDLVVMSFVDDMVRQTFVAFWDVAKFEQHGLKRVGDNIVQGKTKVPITLTDTSSPTITIHEIDGWLSLEHLNSILTRSIRSSPARHNKNPFVAAFKRANALEAAKDVAFSIPDLTILPALYKSFGVESFDELELSEGEMQSLAESCKRTIYNDIWETTDTNGKIIRALEVVSPMRQGRNTLMVFTDAPLSGFMRKLESLMENHKNPQGFQGGADIFQRIADGQIRGKELGQLCIANKEMLNRCTSDNYRIFRLALKREFGITWTPNLYGYKNPRDLYGRMHTAFFYRGFETPPELIRNGIVKREPGDVLVVPGPNDPPFRGAKHLVFCFNAVQPDLSFVFHYIRYQDVMLIGAGKLIEAILAAHPERHPEGALNNFIKRLTDWASGRSMLPGLIVQFEVTELPEGIEGSRIFSTRSLSAPGY